VHKTIHNRMVFYKSPTCFVAIAPSSGS